MSKGRKICPECNAEVGARVIQCNCRYDFFAKEVKKEMFTEKPKQRNHLAEGKGKKRCPECLFIVGARVKICAHCDYNFFPDGPKEKKVEIMNPIVQNLMETMIYDIEDETEKLTPDEHAQRILELGEERAKNLLFLAQEEKKWNYVNWEMVREGLEKEAVVTNS